MAQSFPHFDLLDFLNELKNEEFSTFKTHLRQEIPKFKPIKPIPWPWIKNASREDLAKKLKEHFPGQQVWEVMMSVLPQIGRKDLWLTIHEQMSHKPNSYKEYMSEKFQLIWNTETCLQVPERFYRESVRDAYMIVKSLFIHEPGPITVVLKGLKGAGRTTFLRKVMWDWAVGNLLDRFKFVFFFYVYEMNSLVETSLVDLIIMQWPESSQMIEEIFSEPEKILFIMDGFEELKFDLEFRTNLCADWNQKQPTQIILSSLLQKKMLPESSLLLELGKTTVPRIYFLLHHPRDIYLAGFDHAFVQNYFWYFFHEKEKAAKTFHFVKDKPIYKLCQNPYTCWLVCNCIQRQLDRRESLRDHFETDTLAHACFFKELFKARCANYPFRQNKVRVQNLCSLAAEGKWTQKLVFTSEDLERHGISESDTLMWLDGKILKPRDDRFVFCNLRLQSFCGAMFYFLPQPTENPNRAIGSVTELLTATWVHGQIHLYQMGSFLVGLTKENVVKILEPCFGSLLHKDVRREMIRCLKSLSQQENKQTVRFKDLFDSLMECQDGRLVAQVVNLFEEMSVSICDLDELRMSAHCLKHTRYLKKLRLRVRRVFPDGPDKEMIKALWKDVCLLFRNNANLQTLELDSCHFHPTLFQKLCKALNESEYHLRSLSCNFMSVLGDSSAFFNATLPSGHLRHLNLYGTRLKDAMKGLCDALRHPSSRVEELMLGKCDISPENCETLGLIISSKKVKHLSLVDNPLKNEGMKILCEALKHPSCSLETLMLSFCGLTSVSCGRLSLAFLDNRSLTVLDLGFNFLQDKGVTHLCQALSKPDCTLEELWLQGCYFTNECLKDIFSLVTCNNKLKTLKLGNNEIYDFDVQWLCSALKHPKCKLEILGLDLCPITDDCCENLALALKSSQTLKSLNLDWITLNHNGLVVLCEALSSEDCVLELLGLDKSALEEESQLLLQAVEEKKPRLTIRHLPWIEKEHRMKGVPLETTYK